MYACARYGDVPVFISASTDVIDLECELPRGLFDIQEHAFTALPIALYIKSALAEACWQPAEIPAVLIIDDPLLKRSHGFVDFAELLSLMKRHHFSTNIAFIPWNWRRSKERIAKLFLQNPDYYSISVHGCDHTRAEFGSGSVEELFAKTRLALTRMAAHEKRTGLAHNPVMVFPQGVFSAAAMTALKHSGLVAAVNNDTISADSSPLPITVADLWDVAIMKYDNFPLFTRRYPWEGLENFAFDALLGKPAIAIIHHDACKDHCSRLVEFIDRLNASRVRPLWRDLSGAVRRSYRRRNLGKDVVEVETYATETSIENDSPRPKQFVLTRRESHPASVRDVEIGSGDVEFTSSDDALSVSTRLQPGERAIMRVLFKELRDCTAQPNGAWTEARIMLRRYSCELRDNYVTKGKLILKSAMGRKDTEWA